MYMYIIHAHVHVHANCANVWLHVLALLKSPTLTEHSCWGCRAHCSHTPPVTHRCSHSTWPVGPCLTDWRAACSERHTKHSVMVQHSQG